ncbi:MAG: glycosyltransferase family 4 protein [Desulfuromonadales bacterium]
MNILFLSLGDISVELSSSGTPYNLYNGLIKEFDNVIAASADLISRQRWINYLASFAPNISFWRERTYKNTYSFRKQTLNAEKAVKNNPGVDYILQFQTMFSPTDKLHELNTPLGIYTDYTIAMAKREYPLWAPFKNESEYNWWYQNEKLLFKHAKHVFTFSNPTRRSIIDDYGIDKDKVFCVRAGTPFIPIVEKTNRRETRNFLLVGRDYKRKGVEFLIDAFSQLKSKYPMIQLCIVGCKISAELPGVTNIPLETDRNRMRELFLASDVFVLPSIAEPFGYVYIEAMSSGLPCIGTNTGGVPDIIVNDETGFIVPVGDVNSLRDKMEFLIMNPDIANRFGVAGLCRFKQNYQWDSVVKSIADTIRSS